MITHVHIEVEDLATFALHACAETDAATIEQHVRSCPPCRDELAQVRKDLGTYARLVTVLPVAEEKRERMIERIAIEKKTPSLPWQMQTTLAGSWHAQQRLKESAAEGTVVATHPRQK